MKKNNEQLKRIKAAARKKTRISPEARDKITTELLLKLVSGQIEDCDILQYVQDTLGVNLQSAYKYKNEVYGKYKDYTETDIKSFVAEMEIGIRNLKRKAEKARLNGNVGHRDSLNFQLDCYKTLMRLRGIDKASVNQLIVAAVAENDESKINIYLPQKDKIVHIDGGDEIEFTETNDND